MSLKAGRLVGAIAGARDYLLARQSPDGAWTDWELPPGSSSEWTTGYVGYQLASLPPELEPPAAPNLQAAAQWLLDNQFPDGGWGYNRAVGPDADSTAFAIQSLASAGRPAPEAAYARLARHQGPDGGFSTYLPDGVPSSWTVSHPDVSPSALLALLTQAAPDPRALSRGVEYVLGQQAPGGLWNSFWWNSPLYATQANLSFLRAAGVPPAAPVEISRISPENPFEMALAISISLAVDPAGLRVAICGLVEALLEQQASDGSWPSAPILRITRRDCFEPWRSHDPGLLFSDPRRLFTTSTVLNALSKALLRL